jgi:urease accessory protein
MLKISNPHWSSAMTTIAKPGPATLFRLLLGLCAGAMVLLPEVASAHPGSAGHMHGFGHGFSHPFGGIDHVLAMVAVGLFAAHLGGWALWLVPLSFVSVMTFAGVSGVSGAALPFAEIGLALSVVVLGLAIAFQLNVPTLVAASFVGFFAMFHGYAHGAEMPAGTSGLSYGLGFVCATVLLHATGVGLGVAIGRMGRSNGRRITQVGGAAISTAGVALLL